MDRHPALQTSRAVSRPSLVLGVIAALVAMALLGACTSAGTDADAEPSAPLASTTEAPRSYRAEWLIDAEAVGADGPGFPFLYREVIDDRNERYLVQSPNHLASQQPDQVVFCAAIFRSDPYCALSQRSEEAPPVLSYPVQLLRSWGPSQLYDIASYREIDVVARNDPDSWSRRTDSFNGIAVECFDVIGETTAAGPGFEVCFTADDLHLVAAVDLQGDLVYEIDLQAYVPVIDDDFATGLDDFYEEKATLQDQLLSLFPEIPAARPTPTPEIVSQDG